MTNHFLKRDQCNISKGLFDIKNDKKGFLSSIPKKSTGYNKTRRKNEIYFAVPK